MIGKILRENYFLILIVIFAAFLFSINLNKPYVGHHDFNSAFFSTIARNLIRYDIVSTKLGLVAGAGPQNPPFDFYTHNVPLHPWLVAVSFSIFGVGEWQARIVSIIFSLASVTIIFLIGKKVHNGLTGYLAAIFFATSAMYIYFSSNVFPEPQAIFFSLLTYLLFLNLLEKDNKKTFLALLVVSFLAYITVWGSYFLTPFLFLYYLLFAKRQVAVKKILVILFAPFLTFGFYLAFNFALTGDIFWEQLTQAILSRANIADKFGYFAIPPLDFVEKELLLSSAYFSKVTLVLVSTWFLVFFLKIAKKRNSLTEMRILILFLWGVSYPALFRQAAFIHDYFLIYLAPFFALAPAHLLSRLHLPRPWLIVVFIFPLLQLAMVRNFAKALLLTDANRDGYYLGTYLSNKTDFGDKILVLSGQFGAHFGVFADFYADRNIVYRDFNLTNFKKLEGESQFNYAVVVEGRDTEKALEDYLVQNYQHQTSGLFKIFTLER